MSVRGCLGQSEAGVLNQEGSLEVDFVSDLGPRADFSVLTEKLL